MALRRDAEAELSYLQSLSLEPEQATIYNALGGLYERNGHYEEAITSLQHAVRLRPDRAIDQFNLGFVHDRYGQQADALACYQQALSLDPNYVDAHNNLALVWHRSGNLAAAEMHLRQALQIAPEFAEAHIDLGDVQRDLGHIDEALASYTRAKALKPDNVRAHSNQLFALTHSATVSPAEVFAHHLAFGQQFARDQPVHTHHADPSRRLRVGFVSGDLRQHAVAYFLEPILAALDAAQFDLYAYANYPHQDAVTVRLQTLLPNWRQVSALTDADLAELIRVDGIDILIDLSGHTGHNRLLVFALKPAPIQMTWLGYPNTTGLAAIDYVLSDRFNSPYGLYEHYYVEKFVRLPSCSTFQPDPHAPPLQPLPALTTGHITFASFNRPSKLSDDVIATWSRVLQSVQGARLLLGNVSDANMQQSLAERFACCGIATERLEFHPTLPLADYLALHHQVDIVLDSWPYSGGTTTYHALWMGVPIMALRGPSRAHCLGSGILQRLGLDDWVADDVDTFVQKVIAHASDLERLAALRLSMRERWQASPLLLPATVARGIEAALRVMWQRWCAGLPVEHFEVEA